ncbi:hypothetical protein V1524DRAFT_462357 [Lipomyces starkeyi]
MSDVLTGQLPYPLPIPFTPGVSSVARVEATGPDATSLKHGQLVYADLTVRARDDIGGEKGTVFLQGLMAGATAEAQNLAEQARKHGSWAELQIVQGFRVKVIWPGKYQLSLRFSFLPFYYLLEFHFFPTPHPGSFSMVLDEATKSRHVFNGKDYDTDRAIQILQTALGEAKQFEETKAR